MEFILEFVFEIFWEVLIEGVFIGAAEYFGVYYARRRDQETPASKDEFRKRRLLKYLFLGILVGVIIGYATSPPSELTSLYLLSSLMFVPSIAGGIFAAYGGKVSSTLAQFTPIQRFAAGLLFSFSAGLTKLILQ